MEPRAETPPVTQALPPHLRLGITLAGMRELYERLPADALDRGNAAIPRNSAGAAKFPKNDAINGYVNQFFMAKDGEADNLGVCERLSAEGGLHVGEANVFVSWFLGTPIITLLDALGQFLTQHRLEPSKTFFWVCDYVIRQTDVKADLAHLGHCVAAVGHTVLLLEPWDAPMPLKRSYCLKEVYHTQTSGAKLDVIMSASQQAAFEAALAENFDTIEAAVAAVDIRTAECRNAEDQAAIRSEIEAVVGASACNAVVVKLVREQLVKQARVALDRLPEAEQATSKMINQVALVLKKFGRLAEAELLYREAVEGCRRKLRGPEELLGCTREQLAGFTLVLVSNLAALLQEQGNLPEAEPLCHEVVDGRRKALGARHPDTLSAMNNLAQVLQARGKLAEAEALMDKVHKGFREVNGAEHPETLRSMHNLASLLQAEGKLAEAEPMCREAHDGRCKLFGARHPDTLSSMDNLARLLQAKDKLAEAEPLFRQVLDGFREVLGAQHPSTLCAVTNMAGLLVAMGRLTEAETLYGEAIEAHRKVHGARHPDTMGAVNNLAMLLHQQGKTADAEPLMIEALEGKREVLGTQHPDTLISANNLAGLLQAQGKLAEAEPLFGEVLAGFCELLGAQHPHTLGTMGNLAVLLREQGRLAEAEPLSVDALAGFRELFGAQHPSTLGSANNLATLYYTQGRLMEAERLYRSTLEGLHEAVGAQHPHALAAAGNLADCLRELGRLDEAQRVLGETPTVAAQILGPRHERALVLQARAARLNHAQPGGAAAGVEELSHVVAEMREVLGADHRETRKYADVLAAMGNVYLE